MTVSEIKAAVRKRDGYRCTECGMPEDEHRRICGRGLEVHRINPGTPYSVEGSTSLCGSCHKKKPRSKFGESDYVRIRIARDQFLDLLGVTSLDGFSASTFLLELLSSVPRQLPHDVLAYLRRKRNSHVVHCIARDILQMANFVCIHTRLPNGKHLKLTDYLDRILRPVITKDHADMLHRLMQEQTGKKHRKGD